MSDKKSRWIETALTAWGFLSIAAFIGAVWLGNDLPRGGQIAVVASCGSWYAIQRWRERSV